jgi:hypothetical protein
MLTDGISLSVALLIALDVPRVPHGTSLGLLLLTDVTSFLFPTAHGWDIPFHSTAHCMGRPSGALLNANGMSLCSLTAHQWDIPFHRPPVAWDVPS